MTNFARIINAVAVDISSAPAEHFHPSIAADFVAVPDTVQPGWRLVDGAWIAPEPAEAAQPIEVGNLTPTPPEFLLLFTFAERVAIRATRSTDPAIDDLLMMVEDPRLTMVDLRLQSTRDAIGYLAAQGLIGAERVEQILAGVMQ